MADDTPTVEKARMAVLVRTNGGMVDKQAIDALIAAVRAEQDEKIEALKHAVRDAAGPQDAPPVTNPVS